MPKHIIAPPQYIDNSFHPEPNKTSAITLKGVVTEVRRKYKDEDTLMAPTQLSPVNKAVNDYACKLAAQELIRIYAQLGLKHLSALEAQRAALIARHNAQSDTLLQNQDRVTYNNLTAQMVALNQLIETESGDINEEEAHQNYINTQYQNKQEQIGLNRLAQVIAYRQVCIHLQKHEVNLFFADAPTETQALYRESQYNFSQYQNSALPEKAGSLEADYRNALELPDKDRDDKGNPGTILAFADALHIKYKEAMAITASNDNVFRINDSGNSQSSASSNTVASTDPKSKLLQKIKEIETPKSRPSNGEKENLSNSRIGATSHNNAIRLVQKISFELRSITSLNTYSTSNQLNTVPVAIYYAIDLFGDPYGDTVTPVIETIVSQLAADTKTKTRDQLIASYNALEDLYQASYAFFIKNYLNAQLLQADQLKEYETLIRSAIFTPFFAELSKRNLQHPDFLIRESHFFHEENKAKVIACQASTCTTIKQLETLEFQQHHLVKKAIAYRVAQLLLDEKASLTKAQMDTLDGLPPLAFAQFYQNRIIVEIETVDFASATFEDMTEKCTAFKNRIHAWPTVCYKVALQKMALEAANRVGHIIDEQLYQVQSPDDVSRLGKKADAIIAQLKTEAGVTDSDDVNSYYSSQDTRQLLLVEIKIKFTLAITGIICDEQPQKPDDVLIDNFMNPLLTMQLDNIKTMAQMKQAVLAQLTSVLEKNVTNVAQVVQLFKWLNPKMTDTSEHVNSLHAIIKSTDAWDDALTMLKAKGAVLKIQEGHAADLAAWKSKQETAVLIAEKSDEYTAGIKNTDTTGSTVDGTKTPPPQPQYFQRIMPELQISTEEKELFNANRGYIEKSETTTFEMLNNKSTLSYKMWGFIQYCKGRDDTPENFFADRFDECAVKYRPLSM